MSLTSATLTLIWPSHIDLSLVTPSPSTTTVNSIPNSYGDSHTFSSHGYYCVVHRHEFISLPFQRISSGTSPEYVLVDQTWFSNFFNSILSIPPVSTILRFFSHFPFFFSVKMWFDMHAMQRWGDQLKMDRFWRSLLERPEFVDSQECTNKYLWQNLSILLKNLQIILKYYWLQNVTRCVIPEVCANTRVTSVTVMEGPYSTSGQNSWVTNSLFWSHQFFWT